MSGLRFHDGASGAALVTLPDALPCPYCGSSDVEVFTAEPDPAAGDTGSAFAQCCVCLSQGPSAAHAHDAARLWNTRRPGVAAAPTREPLHDAPMSTELRPSDATLQ